MPEMVYWHWLAIGLAFLILEMLMPGAIVMWFGIGAILLGLHMLLGAELSLAMQLLIFSGLSLLGVVVGRRYVKWDGEEGDKPNLSRRGDSYIGQTYVLVKAIENGRGTIRLGDTDWRVTGEDAAVGTSVKVTGVDGATLIVEVPRQASGETQDESETTTDA
ncbi:MAG: NfeD family protein [Alphaproteobacteria bacterium]